MDKKDWYKTSKILETHSYLHSFVYFVDSSELRGRGLLSPLPRHISQLCQEKLLVFTLLKNIIWKIQFYFGDSSNLMAQVFFIFPV